MIDATGMNRSDRHCWTVHPEAACRRVAESQQGIIGMDQALACGMSPDAIWRALDCGKWHRKLPRTYRIGPGTSEWHQEIAAACVWAGGKAAASHRCAAALWTFDGFEPRIIEITSDRKSGTTRRDLVVHHTRLFGSADLAKLNSLPVTTPARTLVDLAGVVGEAQLGDAVEDALRRKLTTIERLDRAVDRRGSRPRGAAVMRRLLRELAGDRDPSGSRFEIDLRRLLVRAGLPRPVGQFPVFDGPDLIAVIDLAYPAERIAI